MNNIIMVTLDASRYAEAPRVRQYDYGQTLRIQGGDLPKVVEVHYSMQEKSGDSTTRIGTTIDGVIEAPVPDSMLENNDCAEDYTFYAYIYVEDGVSGNTEYEIAIPVTARSKPEVPGTPEEPELFKETINAVNDAADRAETAEQNAKASETEASKYAASASKSAVAAEKTKEDALREVGEKKQEAIEAIREQEETSVGKITTHTDDEIQRIQSQTAESKGELEQTITDASVANKKLEESIRTAGDTKKALDKSTELAGTAKTELDTSIREAGEAKTALDGSTNTAGEMQETLSATVKQAGTLDASLGEKIEVGTQLNEDITASGEKAVQDIQTAGSEQLDKMQAVAEEFTADRGQITKNKEDITGLSAQIYNTDIVEETSDTQIIVEDSAEGRGLRNLKVYGWSKQESTTGAQLLDISTFRDQIVNGVTIKNNGDGTLTVTGAAQDKVAYISIGKIEGVEEGKKYCFEGFYSLSDGNIESFAAQDSNSIAGMIFKDAKTITAKSNSDIVVQLKCRVGIDTNFTIKPFVHEGTTALPYESYTGGQPSPSPDYPQEVVSAGAGGEVEITVCGKNLFNANKYMNYTFIQSNTLEYDNTYPTIKIFKFNVKGGEKYSYTLTILNNYTCAFGKEDDISNLSMLSSSYSGTKKIITVTVPDGYNAMYICAPISDGRKMMVVKEDTNDIPYEPYHEPQSLSISTPTGLPAIPVDTGGNYTDADGQQWISDYVDFAKGKYIQNVCKLPLKNLVKKWYTWGVNNLKGNITGFYAYLTDAGYRKSKNMEVLTNICRYHRDVWGGANVGCNINNSNQYVEMSLPTDILEDTSTKAKAIESFAKIIEQTDAYVMYVLAEPIETDLTPEEIQVYQSFITYAPTTIVENDADCHMKLSYIADSKAYIDKKFSELSAAIVASASEAE